MKLTPRYKSQGVHVQCQVPAFVVIFLPFSPRQPNWANFDDLPSSSVPKRPTPSRLFLKSVMIPSSSLIGLIPCKSKGNFHLRSKYNTKSVELASSRIHPLRIFALQRKEDSFHCLQEIQETVRRKVELIVFQKAFSFHFSLGNFTPRTISAKKWTRQVIKSLPNSFFFLVLF